MIYGEKDKYTDENLKENENSIALKTAPEKGLIVKRNIQTSWEFKGGKRCWMGRKNNFQRFSHMASPAVESSWRLDKPKH